jgi:hypothetical protein
VDKLDVYLLFFNQEKKPYKFFSGEIVVDNNFRHFVGSVSESGNPENEMKIVSQSCAANSFIFSMSSGGEEQVVKLKDVAVKTPFGNVNLGLSGSYGKPGDDQAMHKSVIGSFCPKGI